MSSNKREISITQTFGTRKLQKKEDVFNHNAWDNVEWNPEKLEEAQKIVDEQHKTPLPEEIKVKYDDEKAAEHWNQFYSQHQNKFFKDRNWLQVEFPELFEHDETQKRVILEIGCGVGNTIFPILMHCKEKPNFFIYGCDYSKTAIDIIKEHKEYDTSKCEVFVCDISSQELPDKLKVEQVDVVVLIFVLSALDPSTFEQTLAKIFQCLKPGGLLLFRDYGRYDLAQLRFKKGHLLGENFYVRGDGTRVYFFTQEEIGDLAIKSGFKVEQNAVDKRLLVNRMRQLEMYRVWLQAKFRKPILSDLNDVIQNNNDEKEKGKEKQIE